MLNYRIFRIIAFLIGIGNVFVAGSTFIVHLYGDCLKKQFRLTDGQLNVVTTFSMVGFALSLPSGLVKLKFGTVWLCTIGFILTVSGHLLCWSSFFIQKSHQFPYLALAMIYFLIGHGSTYLYLASVWANSRNFRKSFNATIFGFFNGIFIATPFILTIAHKILLDFEWYKCDKPNFESETDLADFQLFLAICSVLFGFLGILTLHEYKGPDESEMSHSLINDPSNGANYPDIRDYTSSAYEYGGNDSTRSSFSEEEPPLPTVGFAQPSTSSVSQSTDADPNFNQSSDVSVVPPNIEHRLSRESNQSSSGDSLTGWTLIRRPDFHFLLWPFVLISTASSIFAFNVDEILEKFARVDQTVVDEDLKILIFLQILAPILIGYFSDKTCNSLPRVNICIFSIIPCCFCSLFLFIFPNLAFVYSLTLFCLVFAQICSWTCIPGLIKEKFGSKFFAVNLTIILTVWCLFFAFLNIFFQNSIVNGDEGALGIWLIFFDFCFILSLVMWIAYAWKDQ